MRKRGKIFAVISGSILVVIFCAGAAFLAASSNGVLKLLPKGGQRTEVQEEREEQGQKAQEEREEQGQKVQEEREEQREEQEQKVQVDREGQEERERKTQKEADKILEETAIHYQVVYNMKITSGEMAAAAIAEEGQRQRANYDNPEVEAIELRMEEEFGIFAVNLGEMSRETAEAVYDGFSYMYEKYPCLQGSLTNLTLGNMGNKTGGTMARTDRMAFVVNGDYGKCPFVEKYYIVLNARAFLDDEELKKTCRQLSESGYWPEGADVSSIVVHELGHQLQNVIVQKKFGLECPYYITEENVDAFSLYNTDRLSPGDNTMEKILIRAYERWQEVYGNLGEYEEFVRSISDYAMGDEKEGKYSPSETFAEAVADVYLNGENAADASKAITEIIDEIFASEEEIFKY